MGLDIRWPIGLMFSLIGAILVIYGALTGTDAEMYERSLKININLYWGVLLFFFGAWMLYMAWKASKDARLEAGHDQSDAPHP